MSDFEAAYKAWRRAPFPPNTDDERLGDLHDDLAVADTWVADTVIPYADNGVVRPSVLDVVAELRQLCRRADELGSGEVTQAARKLASAYGAYAQLLIAVYQAFLDLQVVRRR
jgi:hypothetical protein